MRYPLAKFFSGFPGGGHGLVPRSRDSLARLAADDVPEGILEALGAAICAEAVDGLRLLGRAPRSVEPPRPGRARLADPDRAIERDGKDEEAHDSVEEALLGEADRDQREDHQRGDDAAEEFVERTGLERERREAEDDQRH